MQWCPPGPPLEIECRCICETACSKSWIRGVLCYVTGRFIFLLYTYSPMEINCAEFFAIHRAIKISLNNDCFDINKSLLNQIWQTRSSGATHWMRHLRILLSYLSSSKTPWTLTWTSPFFIKKRSKFCRGSICQTRTKQGFKFLAWLWIPRLPFDLIPLELSFFPSL